MASYTPNATDSSRPFDSDDPSIGAGEFRALKTRVNQLAGAAALPISQTLNQAALRNLIYPHADGFWKDIYKGGWRPGFFNQQWGASHVGFELTDAGTDSLVKFEAAHAQVNVGNANTNINLNAAAGNYYQSIPIKVAEAESINAVWVKLAKVGNPAGSLTARIIADSGGTIPASNVPVTNGTANTVLCRLVSSRTYGDWVRFVFAAPPVLAANTQYWVVLNMSGGVDASNYLNLCCQDTTYSNHPVGNKGASGTSGAAFTSYTNFTGVVLVEPVSANQFFNPALGQFNSALTFMQGSPINQSKVLTNALANFIDGNDFTALHRVSKCVKGSSIADYLYGIDHDRIAVFCQTITGYAQVSIYTAAGVLTTLTGVTDISGGSMSDVAVYARMAGDGADVLQLWVNGAMEASVTAQTFTFNKNFRDLGTAWLGGGFPLAPAWTQNLDMTLIPSAAGWTWTGTGTEANCMSIAGGMLYQNRNGYAATDTGYYLKSATALVNATGTIVRAKFRVQDSTNLLVEQTSDSNACINIYDGTKRVSVKLNEFYLNGSSGTTYDLYAQADLQTQQNELLLISKGSDYYVFLNGRLVIDGTVRNTNATASNQITFGDGNATSGENSDVIWDTISYYSGGPSLPQVATGMMLHEYACWSGSRTALLSTLWNAGIPQSVKSITGMTKNYVDEIPFVAYIRGVAQGIAITGTFNSLRDSNTFILGNNFKVNLDAVVLDGVTASTFYVSTQEDGKINTSSSAVTTGSASYIAQISIIDRKTYSYSGAHHITFAAKTGAANSVYAANTDRNFSVRSDT